MYLSLRGEAQSLVPEIVDDVGSLLVGKVLELVEGDGESDIKLVGLQGEEKCK
jgi:hypothetical protein